MKCLSLWTLSNSRLEFHIHFRRSAGAQCTPLYQGANHNALRFVEVILQLEWIGPECVECQVCLIYCLLVMISSKFMNDPRPTEHPSNLAASSQRPAKRLWRNVLHECSANHCESLMPCNSGDDAEIPWLRRSHSSSSSCCASGKSAHVWPTAWQKHIKTSVRIIKFHETCPCEATCTCHPSLTWCT